MASLNINGMRDRKKGAVTKELFEPKKLDVILRQVMEAMED